MSWSSREVLKSFNLFLFKGSEVVLLGGCSASSSKEEGGRGDGDDLPAGENCCPSDDNIHLFF